MGYSYTVERRITKSGRIRRVELLSCDHCGHSGGVSKRRCPYGYCPSAALHKDCAKMTGWARKETHARCEIQGAEWRALEARRAGLENAGIPVRCAALSDNATGRVKVWFRARTYQTARLMDHATYDALPLATPQTIQDYEGVIYANGHAPMTTVLP